VRARTPPQQYKTAQQCHPVQRSGAAGQDTVTLGAVLSRSIRMFVTAELQAASSQFDCNGWSAPSTAILPLAGVQTIDSETAPISLPLNVTVTVA
jgi:hypothetical protein